MCPEVPIAGHFPQNQNPTGRVVLPYGRKISGHALAQLTKHPVNGGLVSYGGQALLAHPLLEHQGRVAGVHDEDVVPTRCVTYDDRTVDDVLRMEQAPIKQVADDITVLEQSTT
jgi:hypothetical protein